MALCPSSKGSHPYHVSQGMYAATAETNHNAHVHQRARAAPTFSASSMAGEESTTVTRSIPATPPASWSSTCTAAMDERGTVEPYEGPPAPEPRERLRDSGAHRPNHDPISAHTLPPHPLKEERHCAPAPFAHAPSPRPSPTTWHVSPAPPKISVLGKVRARTSSSRSSSRLVTPPSSASAR